MSCNHTTWLNIAFLLLAAMLLVRSIRTGGVPMLKMTGGEPDPGHEHAASSGEHEESQEPAGGHRH